MHICSFFAAVLGLLCVNAHVLCRVTLLRTLHVLVTCVGFFTCLCRGTTQTFGVCNVNCHAIFGGSPSGNKSF